METDYVYGYESSKVTETFQVRIKTFGCGYPLVQRARAIRRGDQWHQRLATGQRPSAYVGPIASGEQVIAAGNTETHTLLQNHCGDTLTVEMEGWGFLFAAHTNAKRIKPALPWRPGGETPGLGLSSQDPHRSR